jgi:hypothetical protein
MPGVHIAHFCPTCLRLTHRPVGTARPPLRHPTHHPSAKRAALKSKKLRDAKEARLAKRRPPLHITTAVVTPNCTFIGTSKVR